MPSDLSSNFLILRRCSLRLPAIAGAFRDILAPDGLRGYVVGQTGAGRDQAADDDVFLQAAQIVRLPMIAASVSTRVVSWKEAAEMNESVDSEALVIPSSMCS